MQGGDISNETPARFLFVFDGLIGRCRRVAVYNGLVRARMWRKAFRQWDINDHVLLHMRDLYWRRHYRFDVVTWQPEEIADQIFEYFERINLPVSYVWSSDPDSLAREIALMPDVVAIFDANPQHLFRWGNRGVHVPEPNAFNPFG